MKIKGALCACQAGCFAALASVCAKLATSSESASSIAAFGIEQILGIPQEHLVVKLSIALRVVGVIGIFLCNAIMWVLFTKSMHLCSSTLKATAFNTASNFIFTAIFGCLIFGDRIGLQWFCGSLLMVIGLVILHRSSQDETTQIADTPDAEVKESGHDGVNKQMTKKQKQKVS